MAAHANNSASNALFSLISVYNLSAAPPFQEVSFLSRSLFALKVKSYASVEVGV
ncbi:hypothetical protein ACI0FR_01239 [Paenochrobactrum sp. BZR 201-1]